MVLFTIPHKSTFIQLESILIECSDGRYLSCEGDKAKRILFDCYRRRDNGYFEIRKKSGKILKGKVFEIFGISVNDGPIEIFTYEEFRVLSNEFFELIRETYYKPTKVNLPDYEI